MSVIFYPDGTQLSSTALTQDQINQAIQIATCQMLGILTSPATYDMTLTVGQLIAIAQTVNGLYTDLAITCTGLPDGTVICGINPALNQVFLSNAATQDIETQTTISDPNAYSSVRIGWQPQGQPGWLISEDVCILRCTPTFSEYSKMRDVTGAGSGDTFTATDVFTRAWRVYWTFYGPNSLDHARAVRSALVTIRFVDELLAASNLYVNPAIDEPSGSPELFQGQWWDRSDFYADFNEEITEVFSAQTVASVEIIGNVTKGPIFDITVQE